MSILGSQGSHFINEAFTVGALIIGPQPYEWRGFRQMRGIRPKAKRVLSQFSPHDFTAFKWGTATDFLHFSTVVLLLAVFLAAELNPFYLKVGISYFIHAGTLDPILQSFRAYFGWSRTILSSSYDWCLCSYARAPPFVNFIYISMTLGKCILLPKE